MGAKKAAQELRVLWREWRRRMRLRPLGGTYDLPMDGWNLSERQVRHIRILEYLVDRNRGIFHSLTDLYGPSEAHRAHADVDALEQRGLVHPARSWGSSIDAVSVRLTDAGRSELDEVRDRRNDASARRWGARSALVLLSSRRGAVDDDSAVDLIKVTVEADLNFWGDPYSEVELWRAAEWLHEQDYIGGPTVEEHTGPIRAWLTDRGEECADDFGGDVRRHYRRTMTPSDGPAHVENHYGDRHYGDNIAVGDLNESALVVGNHAQQSVHLQRAQLADPDAVDAMRTLVEQLHQLDLAPGERQQLDSAHEAAVQEIGEGAGTAAARQKLLTLGYGWVDKAGSGAAGAALGLGLAWLKQHWGLPYP